MSTSAERMRDLRARKAADEARYAESDRIALLYAADESNRRGETGERAEGRRQHAIRYQRFLYDRDHVSAFERRP